MDREVIEVLSTPPIPVIIIAVGFVVVLAFIVALIELSTGTMLRDWIDWVYGFFSEKKNLGEEKYGERTYN